MIFLPVMGRELRVFSRRPATYYSRCAAAAAALVTTIATVYASAGGVLNALSAGRDLFVLLSSLGYVFALLEGAFLTADCLSQEKREGTLGLLFLTDLQGYDVVAGKLMARTGNAAYCLLAAVPAPGLAIFLGGVTGADLFRMGLALLNVLFYSASLGMLVSALCRSGHRALSGALLLALLLGVGLPLLAAVTGAVPPGIAAAAQPFLTLTPSGPFTKALGAGLWRAPAFSFAAAFWSSHLAAWGFLAAASLVLPRSWRVTGRSNPRRWGRACMTRTRWRNTAFSVAFLAAIVAVYLGLGSAFGSTTWFNSTSYIGLALLLHLMLMYDTTVQACRVPAENRQSGVLELLLTTPLGERVVLEEWMLGLKQRMLWPVLFVLAIDLGLIMAGCAEIGFKEWEALAWIALFLGLLSKLLADLYCLAWVGAWQGAKAPTAGLAIRRTLSCVVLLRWFLLLSTLAIVGPLTGGQVFRSALGGTICVAGYFIFYAMTVPHFCFLAMSELNDDLRRMLLSRAGQDSGLLSWWPFRLRSNNGPNAAEWIEKLNRFQRQAAGRKRGPA